MRAHGVPQVVLFTFLAVTFAGCVEETPLESDIPVVRVQYADPDQAFDLLSGVAVPITTTTVSTGAEPSIQVARDGHAIYIGHHQGGYRSLDGGQTWIRMATPFIQGIAVDGWDFAEDEDGVLYATTTNGQLIQVVRSTDDGLSWDPLTRFYPTAVGGVADRPWIDAQGSGQVTLIFNDSGFTNRCMRTSDGGLTWLDQHELSGRPIAGGVALDENGFAYWSNRDGLIYRTGSDNFGVPAGTCINGFRTVQAGQSANGAIIQSQIAAEDGKAYSALPSEDNDANKIVAWDFETNTPKEFVFGLPELKSNTFNTIAVQDGRVYSAWYGSEADGDFNNAGFTAWWDVYVAVIDDFWSATPSVQIFKVGEDNHQGNFCFSGVNCDLGGNLDRDLLDYFGIDVDADGRVHVAYGHDGAGSTATVRYVGITPP